MFFGRILRQTVVAKCALETRDPHGRAQNRRARLTDVLADRIVRVTGWHNHVGNVAEYLTDPVGGWVGGWVSARM